jgi:glycosyltransferase involved in cell wall biosynthesis
LLNKVGAKPASQARNLGDTARDRGQWDEAVKYYTAHLADHPHDYRIFIQLGHALKESGRLEDAQRAYEQAITGLPDDHDVYLHLGHLLKVMNRRQEAITAYQKSLERKADDNHALHELLALGAITEAAGRDHGLPTEERVAVQVNRTVYLDMTDLIEYAKQNPSLSGIQRVVANLILQINSWEQAHPNIAVVPVIPEYDNHRVFSVKRHLVRAMINILSTRSSERTLLDTAISAVYNSRHPVHPKSGDVFVIAGAFWIYVHYDLINNMRRRGVYFGVFIHDLIQISNPEYVHAEATKVFQQKLIDVLTLANFVLTNSHFVAGNVREYISRHFNFTLPVRAVPLATELRSFEQKDAEEISNDVLEICREPFVLSVATLEVRKNHLYLIRIWERLKKELKDIPNLVLVGKWGWDIQELRTYLENSDHIHNVVRILNGASDQDLAYLYRHCLLTSFVSFAEGWGLPVGESLAYGKPCIASNATSIPEVGGALTRYVDPFNLKEGYETFRSILLDRDGIDAWASQIRAEFKPKSWQAFSEEFFSAVTTDSSPGCEHRNPNNCLLAPGVIYHMGDSYLSFQAATGKSLVTCRMTRVAGWHPIEKWVCWASKRSAFLRFRTELPAGTAVMVYCRLQAPGSSVARCTIRIDREEVSTVIVPPQPSWHIIPGSVSSDGELDINLLSAGRFDKLDDRELYVGMRAVAYCATSDLASRVALMEQLYSEVDPEDRTDRLAVTQGPSAAARLTSKGKTRSRAD